MRHLHAASRRLGSKARRARSRLRVELLETRQLLAGNVYTVTSVLDDSATDVGTLWWAITQVNNDTTPGSTPDVIDFDITGSGTQTITIGTALPAITNSVLIDGTSQTDYSASGAPLIDVVGVLPISINDGFSITAGTTTIKGLAIAEFDGAEISVSMSGKAVVESDYLGTADGTTKYGGAEDLTGSGYGVEIDSASNTIGGSTAADGNVIVGHYDAGIYIGEFGSNVIENNMIGVNAAGTAAIANSEDGIQLEESNSNLIESNVISGNGFNGIDLAYGDADNVVSANRIGTNSAGTAAIPNQDMGILVGDLNNNPANNSPSNTITGNVISGNVGDGISLAVFSSDELIQSNEIGTNLAGSAAIQNDLNGIEAAETSDITIGGTTSGAGNLISGNGNNGILLETVFTAPDGTGTLIEGNTIGLNANQDAPVLNAQDGIFQNGADDTTIGGTTTGARNVISGNGGSGISLGTGIDSLVEGNYIGTDGMGTVAEPNETGIDFTNASYATIGGTIAGAGNLISGNNGSGIDCFVIGSQSELIEGNKIGVNVTGVVALSNKANGIRIAGPTLVTIGGTVAGSGNVISGNGDDGIDVSSLSSADVLILGNDIGTDSTGTVSLGNSLNGVEISASAVTVGGSVAAAGNVIVNNSRAGITLDGNTSATGDVLLSNSIYNNGELGISLSGNGIATQNTPNRAQNFPVLSSAIYNGISVAIVGSLNAAASTSYLVQFFASPVGDSSGYGEGSVYLGETTVTTDSNGNVAINNTLDYSGLPFGSVITATATATTVSGNTSEFSQDFTTEDETDVAVTVTSNASTIDPVYVGGSLEYTVTATNTGLVTATGVTVTDTLPSQITGTVTATTSVTGVSATVVGSTVTADFGNLAGGASAEIFIHVTPSATAGLEEVSDTAIVSDSSIDTDTLDKSFTLNLNTTPGTDIVPSATLTVAISAGASSVYVGGNLTYTLTVTNNGLSAASSVSLTDTLPANVTFVSASNGGTNASGIVTWSLGTIADGGTSSVTLVVSPEAAAAGTISDNASVSSSTHDPNGATIAAVAVNTTVLASSDLAVTITPGSSPVLAGNDEVYTITATNNGPSAATGVVVTDTIPSDVTFVSAPGGTGPESNVITFDVGNMADGASVTYMVTVAILGTSASPTTSAAAISGAQNDPVSSNNSQTATVDVTPVSHLVLTLTGAPATVDVGAHLTYTLTVTNSGPSTDPSVSVVDTLPANVTFVSDTNSIAPVSGVISFSVGSLASGASSTLSIVVSPNAAAAGSGTADITDSATVSGEYNVNTSNTVTAMNEVQAIAGLALQVSAPNPAYVDQNLVYTVTVSNAGPSAATGVVVTDTIPAGVTFVSAPGGTGPVSNVITFDTGTIADGASVTYTITVVPVAVTSADAPLVDGASVSFNPDEIDSDSSTATVDTNVLPLVGLSVSGLSISSSSVLYGVSVTYSVDIANSGPSVATGVVVTSPLPANTSLVSGSWVGQSNPETTGSVSVSGGNLVADFGDLAVGETGYVVFTILPSRAAVGQVPLAIAISSDQTNSDTAEASVSGNFTVLDRPGTLGLTSTTDTVDDGAGVANITVSRSGGVAGQVSVAYTTTAITATPGLDYTPVSGTLVFPAGVASETIQIPVLDDIYNKENEDVGITLSDPAGGASLGTSTATLTIVDVKPNTTNLSVSDIVWTGSSSSITGVVLYFNEPLAATAANNVANYTLTSEGPDEIHGTGDDRTVPIDVTYNAAAQSVTLTPSQPLSGDQFYYLSINGSTGTGLTDVAGNPLAGAAADSPGTDYTAQFAVGSRLAYHDVAGDKVSIRLTGGGYLEDLLSGSGEGARLIVVDAAPHHSVLKGTVKRAKHSAGETYLGYTVYGLGKFGQVRVEMPEPTFRVTRYPFSPGTPIVQPSIAAVAVADTKTSKVAARVDARKPAVHVAAPAARSAARVAVKPSMAREFHSFR